MRVAHWDHLLVDWAIAQRGRPYVWGVTDCGALVRSAVAAMYGRDLFPDLPPWETALAATRILKDRGGFATILSLAGATEVPYGFLQRGDIVVARDGFAAYVSLGHTIIGSHPDEGVWEKAAEQVLIDVEVLVLRLPHG